jgi:hypothetical protein
MAANLPWSFLDSSIDRVVTAADRLWHSSSWRTLYGYDEDDYSLQNCTMVLGMKNWGLGEHQVEFVNRLGIVEEIDTRANPGFMLNEGGLFWSVQWLNYWSREAQNIMLTKPTSGLPEGVEVRQLVGGSVCVRLSEKPGRLDDKVFHQLQLECRRRLSFRKA